MTDIDKGTSARLPTPHGEFTITAYFDRSTGIEHLALHCGDVAGEEVLVRVHSECLTGDIFGSLRCDCGPQLQLALARIAALGRGMVIYMRGHEGRGIGIEQKLRAYNLQDQGYDTVDANLLLGHQADERDYTAAALILADWQVDSIRLMTNNPDKIDSLRRLGVRVTARVPLQVGENDENAHYLKTKVERMRHILNLP